ncbi:hypothetical protein M431DRAFT_430483 [Trichoderma harzianum CBS 226.95]|uniref:Transmembrane protein n=1 Tax=Trichoderma harzianum CBS 226.95 TaxID=983964 RepID=A0A2T4ACS3_TRIHA|nr:hypothetical protein M431DRAFT_430483 [Trichoderma harzianum CBS 226.95]PTB54846.1 hypothetical protein M431DRAFT_430483 [Trichoderma harzianum CBS 226.95]
MPVELVLLVPPNGLIRMSLCRSPPNKRCSLFRFSTTPLLRLSFLPCSSDNQHLEEREKKKKPSTDEQEPVFSHPFVSYLDCRQGRLCLSIRLRSSILLPLTLVSSLWFLFRSIFLFSFLVLFCLS